MWFKLGKFFSSLYWQIKMCSLKPTKFLLILKVFNLFLGSINILGNYYAKIYLLNFLNNLSTLFFLKIIHRLIIIFSTTFAIYFLFQFQYVFKLYALAYNFLLYYQKCLLFKLIYYIIFSVCFWILKSLLYIRLN